MRAVLRRGRKKAMMDKYNRSQLSGITPDVPPAEESIPDQVWRLSRDYFGLLSQHGDESLSDQIRNLAEIINPIQTADTSKSLPGLSRGHTSHVSCRESKSHTPPAYSSKSLSGLSRDHTPPADSSKSLTMMGGTGLGHSHTPVESEGIRREEVSTPVVTPSRRLYTYHPDLDGRLRRRRYWVCI